MNVLEGYWDGDGSIPMTFVPEPGGPEYHVKAWLTDYDPATGRYDFQALNKESQWITFSLTLGNHE